MALPLIAGTVRAAVNGTVPSTQQWANVWHFRYAGGASSPGDTDIANLHTLFLRFYSGTAFGSGAAWMTRSPNASSLSRFTYIRLDGSSLGLEYNMTVPGSGGTSATPSECAPVITLRTNKRGRSYRGRIYLPCPNSSWIDTSGRLLAGTRDSTVAQLTGLMAALGGPSVAPFWELGVASYLRSEFTPVSVITMDLDVDVQRRRKK